MTEPAVASSDATNIATTITRDGDDYVVNGRKWWSTGAMRPECKVAIVMGVSDPDARAARPALDDPRAAGHARASRVERSTTVFGYDDGPHGGHGVIDYDDVRVPADEPARPAGRRLHDGAGPPRPRPHPPLHAQPRAWPSARWS